MIIRAGIGLIVLDQFITYHL